MKLSTRDIALAGVFTALLCAVTILVRSLQPVLPIPFSMQPFVIMLAACLMRPRAAFISVLAYVALGLIGVPVFSSPPYGGPAYVLIPSFGFILAFPLMAWVQSLLIRRSSFINFTLAGLAGIVAMYAIALPYLYLMLNIYVGRSVDVVQVLQIGLIPFVAFDIGKLLLSSWLALELCQRLGISRAEKAAYPAMEPEPALAEGESH